MRKLQSKKSSKNANELILAGKYNQAITLLHKDLKLSPDSHWCWMELSAAYYESRKYKLARQYALKAIKLAPSCPLSWWHYAGALYMLDEFEHAKDIYSRILSRGIYSLNRMKYCNEGPEYNVGFINDCRLRIAECYYELKQYKKAKCYTKIFLRKYVPSCLYPKSDAYKLLEKM